MIIIFLPFCLFLFWLYLDTLGEGDMILDMIHGTMDDNLLVK